MTYVRTDIPSRRLRSTEPENVEAIHIELQLGECKWLLMANYRPPAQSSKSYVECATKALDVAFTNFDNVILLGDLNFNMLSREKSAPLTDLCDIFDLSNLVKEATCFTKNSDPSLVDVFLTNRPRTFNGTLVCDTGLSDVHRLVACVMKNKLKAKPKEKTMHRCFKNLDENALRHDIETAPLHVAEIFDELDDVCWMQEKLLSAIIDEHIPVKERKQRHIKAPFMNGKLRKEINYKKKLRRTFENSRTDKNWNNFRTQRNKVTSLKRAAIRGYFFERCAGGAQSRDFWPTIKPFLSKGSKNSQEICLLENGNVISDPDSVCNIFNDHFSKIANDICRNLNDEEVKNHESVQKIRENIPRSEPLVFKQVSEKQVNRYIRSIGNAKATGLDNHSAKILKIIQPCYVTHLTRLVNRMFAESTFPESMKNARVTPIFKKEDPLLKKYYRPVSVLPIRSKIFERAMVDQLNDHFQTLFHPFLSAYRKGYSCQSTLLALTEDWKKALDDGHYVGAILMDLSKAFDCLPHKLLLEKLRAYNISEHAVSLLSSYLSDRKQCVKIGRAQSTHLPMSKGVPQGSIAGPVLFNVFINDIFYFTQKTTLYNYADDNTISYSHRNFDTMKHTLETEGSALVGWFTDNQMEANPGKFQGLAVGKKTHCQTPTFNIQGADIKCTENVKLLGVTIDYQMNFDMHISTLCKKAARQINVLRRIGRHLPLSCRKVIYQSFILSAFNFCPVIWHFCSESNNKKLEKLNLRALRHVYRDYQSDYDKLLTSDTSVSLQLKRQRLIALEVFKILTKQCPSYLNDLIKPLKDTGHNLRTKNVEPPHFKSIKYGKKSFSYSGSKLWNNLPPCLQQSNHFEHFKKQISSWDGTKCKCSMCKYDVA